MCAHLSLNHFTYCRYKQQLPHIKAKTFKDCLRSWITYLTVWVSNYSILFVRFLAKLSWSFAVALCHLHSCFPAVWCSVRFESKRRESYWMRPCYRRSVACSSWSGAKQEETSVKHLPFKELSPCSYFQYLNLQTLPQEFLLWFRANTQNVRA